jgi:pyruvate-formate lyase-activating enzyme
MKLEDIGFYTLSDARAEQVGPTSPLKRCELVLTRDCNFRCPYCRHSGPTHSATWREAVSVVDQWADGGLEAVRFSGGEPTLWPDLARLVSRAHDRGIKRIAISTNGSASLSLYSELLAAGVNDLSVSLDGSKQAVVDEMTGVSGSFRQISGVIAALAQHTYLTVGMVVTPRNLSTVRDTILWASFLGAQDIRIITAAQWGGATTAPRLPRYIVDAHPILKYRMERLRRGRPIRGLGPNDAARCSLVLDDMAVSGGYHYPCIIYMRERGNPIGRCGGLAQMRGERNDWYAAHDSRSDPICSLYCLDVCVAHNNKAAELKGESVC